MMRLYLPDGRQVELTDERIGDGAEGIVWGIAGMPDLCAKTYFEPTDERAARLQQLTTMSPATWDGDHAEHVHVAWPLRPLRDEGGRTVGVLMPRVQGTDLQALFEPEARLAALPDPTWRQLVAIAGRLARLFAMLHEAGLVIGDVSPRNVLVVPSGHVTLIDCDTVRIAGAGSRDASARKITPEYASPQMLREHNHVSTREDDLFGLAILTCQLLMEGDHPFEGVPLQATDEDSIPRNIQLQNDRISHPERLRPTFDLYPVEMLPRQVLELARRTFDEGFENPSARPSAREWTEAAAKGGFEVMGCRMNDRHVYVSTLPSCLWCERVRHGLVDRYPSLQPAGGAGQPTTGPHLGGPWTPPPQPEYHPSPDWPPTTGEPVPVGAGAGDKSRVPGWGWLVLLVLIVIVLAAVL